MSGWIQATMQQNTIFIGYFFFWMMIEVVLELEHLSENFENQNEIVLTLHLDVIFKTQ